MQLDAILEGNREHVRRRGSSPFPEFREIGLAVVACYDPRLDEMLLPALGLSQGDAFLFRTAGAYLPRDSSALRSLTMAVYLFGVRDVIVLGHAECRMARFETPKFIDSFRSRGVNREAFGTADLRVWAGAIPSTKRGVEMTVANLRAAEFLPRDLSVAGLLLHEATGEIEVVIRPEDAVVGSSVAAAQGVGELAPAESEAEAVRAGDEAARDSTTDDPKSKARSALSEALGSVAQALRERGRWREELRALRTDVASQREPAAQLAAIEAFARRVAADSKEMKDTFDRVRREVVSLPRGPRELLDALTRLTEGR